MNLGVDTFVRHATPESYRPGIGLRPGGERPELEPLVSALYRAAFESIAAHSRHGVNVVADFGLHDFYSVPLGILQDAGRAFADLPVLFVGVRCPIEEIMRRRNEGQAGREGHYATGSPTDPPPPVLRWQAAVHVPGIYDLEVDTSELTPAQCAEAILARLKAGPHPTAMARAAAAAELRD